jgi:radical SAM/Cys-rich protein
MNEFDKKIGGVITAEGIDTLQVNVGLACNQACTHCHLNCSPARQEAMSWETMERVIALADSVSPALVDITGGAPELNVHLKDFVTTLRGAGHRVLVRTNLTAMTEAGLTDYPEFFAESGVDLVASMPCYLEENVSSMRGDRCFPASIAVLRRLNALGYGEGGSLSLDLVFNPAVGMSLPPCQAALEKDYKREMKERYGIVFNRLLTITNVPVGRSLDALRASGKDRQYLEMLASSFNPATVDGLMCRHQVNIGWDGRLYDCDFNQALDLGVSRMAPGHIDEFDLDLMAHRRVITGPHCFACTAGAGSSCGGAIEG